MFRCQICGQTAAAGQRANKVVLASRAKTYASRGGGDGGYQRRFRGGRVNQKPYDKGGQGHEIVQEVLACDRCASEAKPATPPQPDLPPSSDPSQDSE